MLEIFERLPSVIKIIDDYYSSLDFSYICFSSSFWHLTIFCSQLWMDKRIYFLSAKLSRHRITSQFSTTKKMGTCSSCFVLVSIFSSGASCMGFFLPYWLKGVIPNQQPNPVKTFFSTFRRCNFPQVNEDHTELVIVKECGHYSSFSDIPSVWWQFATLIVGIGTGLTLFSAVMAFLACWINDMWTRFFIRGLGYLHLTAGAFHLFCYFQLKQIHLIQI